MATPFGLEVRSEQRSVSRGASTLWASVRVEPRAGRLERERAPLALALVVDVSGSMKGLPLAQVITSCELVAQLLGPGDRLALVTFSDRAGVRCGLTPCDEDGRRLLRDAARSMVANGQTNLHAGLEAAAGLLLGAPTGLRRALVVLSDGKPNVGLSSASQLGGYVASLRPLAVSTLGFGLHHDEDVLASVAKAGSGRYAYVPDPLLGRVELARAALAHGGVVADSMELRIKLAEGVELLSVLPSVALRHGGSGVVAPVGDLFVDESRVVALELSVDLPSSSRGLLAEVTVTGRSPDGVRQEAAARLQVDVHSGPHVRDREAQRDVLFVRGDGGRAEARALADRGSLPAAAALLREAIRTIEASEGFVRDDGTPLADQREQLEVEALNYERAGSAEERSHQRKGTTSLDVGQRAVSPPAPGRLIGLGAEVAGKSFALRQDTLIGRTRDCDIPIQSQSLSRRHARVVYLDGKFLLQDLGSTNGCLVNGARIGHAARPLAPGDVVEIGFVQFRFEPSP